MINASGASAQALEYDRLKFVAAIKTHLFFQKMLNRLTYILLFNLNKRSGPGKVTGKFNFIKVRLESLAFFLCMVMVRALKQLAAFPTSCVSGILVKNASYSKIIHFSHDSLQKTLYLPLDFIKPCISRLTN